MATKNVPVTQAAPIGRVALYVLAEEYRAAAERLSDLDLDEQTIQDTLEGISGALETKAINVAMFIRNTEATAAMMDAEIKRMQRRKQACENRAAAIKEYLKQNMEQAGLLEIAAPVFKLAVRNNNESVMIDNERALPEEYMRQPETPPAVPDKVELARALKVEREALVAIDASIAAATSAKDVKAFEKQKQQFLKTCIQGAHLASSGTRLDIR